MCIRDRFTGFDVSILIERGYQFGVILKRVFTPDMSYLDKVWSPLFDTIKMSVIGSVLGSTLALPFAVLASTNINKSRGVVAVLRVVLNIVRTLPTLVIASIFALIFGLGTFAGTVAITVFTFGIVAKMLYESIETIDMGPVSYTHLDVYKRQDLHPHHTSLCQKLYHIRGLYANPQS